MFVTQRLSDGPIVEPLHEDGAPFASVLVAAADADGGQAITFADSATDLVAQLIEGYDAIPDTDEGHDDALFARYLFLLRVAAMHQAALIETAVDAGDFDPTRADDELLTALFSERGKPFEGRRLPTGEVEQDWTADVPLVLIDTDYAPFTERHRPQGRVVWLDPSLETTFLESLDRLSLIGYRVREVAQAA